MHIWSIEVGWYHTCQSYQLINKELTSRIIQSSINAIVLQNKTISTKALLKQQHFTLCYDRKSWDLAPPPSKRPPVLLTPCEGGKPWDGNGRRSLWWKNLWASSFQSLFSHDSVSKPTRNKNKPCLWKNFGRLGKYSYDREWVLYMTVHVNPLYMPLFHYSHECGSHAGPQKPFRTKHLGRYGESPNFQTCQACPSSTPLAYCNLTPLVDDSSLTSRMSLWLSGDIAMVL